MSISKLDSRRIELDSSIAVEYVGSHRRRRYARMSDEYDCCLGDVYELLTSDSSDDDTAVYIWKQANESHGSEHSKRLYDEDGSCASTYCDTLEFKVSRDSGALWSDTAPNA
jgi:hypothetical protein